jgi:hypothetical protein
MIGPFPTYFKCAHFKCRCRHATQGLEKDFEIRKTKDVLAFAGKLYLGYGGSSASRAAPTGAP